VARGRGRRARAQPGRRRRRGTVSPAVAIRGWNAQGRSGVGARAGRAHEGAVRDFGSVNSAPGGAVRLSASLLDVRGDSLWSGRVDGLEVKALADSPRVRARPAQRPARDRRVRAARSRDVVEALRLFLQGRAALPRTAWEPALPRTRAPPRSTRRSRCPLRRMGQVIAFQRTTPTRWPVVRAARRSAQHGLAPRDSLLVVADSLTRRAVATHERALRLADVPPPVRHGERGRAPLPAIPKSGSPSARRGEHFGMAPSPT
jgi:hypothetical protein